MKLLFALLFFLFVGEVQALTPVARKFRAITRNLLSPRYNFKGWYPTDPSCDYCFNDTRRNEQIIKDLPLYGEVSAFMFQEVTAGAYCLTNSSYFIPGNWEPIKAAVEAMGFTCKIGFHTAEHWAGYYDFDHCDKYNSYAPTGNALCLNDNHFTDVSYFVEYVAGGETALVGANATFDGVLDMTVISGHFDSDKVGLRQEELIDTFEQVHPPTLLHPTVVCGDFNAAFSPGNMQHLYINSGYVDPLYAYIVATNQVQYLKPSQPLSNQWYSSANHRDRIDQCWFTIGMVALYPLFDKGTPALYGYPAETWNGVIDNQDWANFPNTQGHDSNEDARDCSCLCQTGSDHYAVSFYTTLYTQ